MTRSSPGRERAHEISASLGARYLHSRFSPPSTEAAPLIDLVWSLWCSPTDACREGKSSI